MGKIQSEFGVAFHVGRSTTVESAKYLIDHVSSRQCDVWADEKSRPHSDQVAFVRPGDQETRDPRHLIVYVYGAVLIG